MKKILLTIFLVVILFFGGFKVVALKSNTEKQDLEYRFYEQSNIKGRDDYTHTVFVEVVSGQFCGSCHSWNTNIHNIYDTGQYDFEYIEMVVYGTGGWGDILNTKAYAWKNLYSISGTPTSIIDGDYRRVTGNGISQLQNKLEECGARSVKNIDASLIVSWLSNAKIQIDIEVENNEATQYNGYIRVPIVEINSRYTTAGGSNYHLGFLDFAITMNTAISIPSGGVYTNSIIWNGNEHMDNHGDDFGDITKDNIKVFLGVFNDANGYIDKTVVALVDENQSPDEPIITGQTTGEPGEEYEYTFVTTDYEEEYIWFYIDWDDGQVEDWIGPYSSSEEVTVSHTFSEKGTYKIIAKAKDINNNEGDWSDPFVVMIGNLAPDSPEISGQTSGKIGTPYTYSFTSTDPNGDDVSYYIKWGDNDVIDWTDFQTSGSPGYSESHTWDEQRQYTIEAKAKDIYGAESDWETLIITMPRNKILINSLFSDLFERCNNLFMIIQKLLL